MKPDMVITEKSKIVNEILAYLIEHSEAQDTLAGIVEWWLLERQIKFQTASVKEALSELVAKGLILEHMGPDSQIHFRINKSKSSEIQKLYKHGT